MRSSTVTRNYATNDIRESTEKIAAITSVRGLAPRLCWRWTGTLGAGFEIAIPNHKHGLDFHLFGGGDFRLDVVAARLELGADFVRAKFGDDFPGIFKERRFIADWEDVDRLGLAVSRGNPMP